MRCGILILPALVIMFMGCSGSPANFKPYPLSSGKQVRVINISRMDFPKSDSALVLDYDSDIPVDNVSELRQEVDEIWNTFRKDVEAANFKAGVIRAINKQSISIVKVDKGYSFVFLQRDDGTWHCINDEKDKK